MAIKRIKITNFKSFKELDLEIGKFNVVVGANASGKSNFTQIFKFLRDIQENSLDDAVSMNGGFESLLNLGVGSQSDLSIQVNVDALSYKGNLLAPIGSDKTIGIDDVTYEFALGLEYKDLTVKRDVFRQSFVFQDLEGKYRRLFKEDNGPAHAEMIISSVDGRLEITFDPPKAEKLLEKGGVVPLLVKLSRISETLMALNRKGGDDSFSRTGDREIPSKTLLIKAFLDNWIERLFGSITIYDIEPHKAKNPVQITGRAELEEDGSNLALVLNKLLDDNEKKRRFFNLIKDLLPFVEDLKTDKFADRSLMFKLSETYYKDEYFPALFISDGTVNVSALLIALYFEKKDFIIIEEPERNIHPRLISKLIEMMKDASKNKQIVVTTHSPEVVKHAGLENLLLVSRDKEGFSTISRPSEKEEVKIFLENELGLDEIFVQNLWGA